MPKTEQVELREESVEKVIALLEAPDLGRAKQIAPKERRTAIAARLRQQSSE